VQSLPEVLASPKDLLFPYREARSQNGQPLYEMGRFPDLMGGSRERRGEEEVDVAMDAADVLPVLTKKNHIGVTADPLPQDPYEGKVQLHPIEVVIESTAVRSMQQHAKKVCRNGKVETGGFLAGRVCRDPHGRVWTHILHSIHDPVLVGTEIELTYPPAMQSEWEKKIGNLGLQNVGFWHSHPTYHPYQSDQRTWGADVQTTYAMCKAWWKVALVIDPLSSDYPELGGYKIIHPGMHGTGNPYLNRDNAARGAHAEPEPVGWRSTTIAISNTQLLREPLKVERIEEEE
jgi:proteasome lid subunit RPN8/RPN11